ncbi:hypothetical protein AB0K00_08980 [Dactylosporangium sp. NPDC049525]|uniref:WD40 repeat domain-containing protein n=1 Tax=Dactylosporangium sp. NPDC049525 TaxID=3154730 RepID=UPI0034184FB4
MRARLRSFQGSGDERGPFQVRDDRRWFEEDTVVTRLSFVRNVVGLVLTIVVSFMTAGIHGSAFDPFERLIDLVFGLLTASIAVLTTMAVLVLTTSAASRGAVARRMWIPLRTMLLFPVFFAAPIVAGMLGYWLGRLVFHTLHDSGHAVLAYLGTALLILLFIGIVLSLLWVMLISAYFCLTNLFRAAEGHPLLAPVAATAIVWVLPQLLRVMRHTDPPTDGLGIAVFYGGAVTVTLLSAVEIVRAARVPGLDLRGAPPATPLPRGPGSWSRGFPGVAVLASLVGAFAATSAFAALAIAQIPGPVGAPVIHSFYFPDGAGEVKAARLSPDGTLLAASPEGDRTFLFNTGSGKLVETLPLPVGYPTALAFSPDGRFLAEAGNDIGDDLGSPIYLWEVAAHKLAAKLAIPPPGPPKPNTSSIRSHYVSSLAFSNDGSRLVASMFDSSSILAWDTATGSGVAGFTAPGERTERGGGVYGIAYLPDSTTMAIHANDGLHFVNAADGKPKPMPGTLGQLTGIVNAFAVSADGSSLAVATSVGAAERVAAKVSVWDLRAGTVRQTVTIPGALKQATTTSIALNDNGSLLATGDWAGHVHVWDAAAGRLTATLAGQTGWSFGGPDNMVEVHAVHGKSALLSWNQQGTIVLWNLNDLPGKGAWNQAVR